MTPYFLHASALLTTACVLGWWQGLMVVAMAASTCTLLRRAPASLRHSFLLASFLAALVLPWLNLSGAGVTATAHVFRVAPQAAFIIAALWLVAVVVRGLQLLAAWQHLRKVRREAVEVRVQGVECFGAGPRKMVLCSSPDVDAPTILGFRAPRLLLPEWMVPQLTESDLQQIALHECEHLRRRDDWTNLMLQVALVLLPLNPALLWLNRKIRLQRELAVDAAVVAQTAKPLAYAACLTRLAEQRQQRGRLRLALSAWGRKSELVRRVHALIDRTSLWTRLQSEWAFAGALAFLLLVSGGMLRVPQVVHVGFAPVQTGMAASLDNSVADPGTTHPVLPLLRTSANEAVRRDGRFLPVQAVPAVFSERKAHHHNVLLNHTTEVSHRHWSSQTPRNANLRRADAPRMLHARYAESLNPSFVTYASGDPSATHFQATPAVFYAPYAAVPMEDGWLLIEL